MFQLKLLLTKLDSFELLTESKLEEKINKLELDVINELIIFDKNVTQLG